MNVRQRVLALRLLEKQKKNPEYARKIGIEVKVKKLKNERVKGEEL